MLNVILLMNTFFSDPLKPALQRRHYELLSIDSTRLNNKNLIQIALPAKTAEAKYKINTSAASSNPLIVTLNMLLTLC